MDRAVICFYAPASDDTRGTVFRFSIRAYVGKCVRMYVLLYECVYVHRYVHVPVRLRLRHLYQVEFCSFIVRYPTAGASVYCGHISSS